jgi:hypothetical protein
MALKAVLASCADADYDGIELVAEFGTGERLGVLTTNVGDADR